MPNARIDEILRSASIRSMQLAPLPSMPPSTKLREVIAAMQQRRAAAVVLAEDGRTVGIFTERDLMNRIVGLLLNEDMPIGEVMTRNPKTLTPDDPIADAIRLMTDKGYRNIPLVDSQGREAGMVSARDIVEFIAKHFPKEILNLPPQLNQVMRRMEGG